MKRMFWILLCIVSMGGILQGEENQKSVDIDAHHYMENSSVQLRLAEDVLSMHKFLGNEEILDVGCGEGKLTAKLASNVPRGSVCGIDPSSSMIKLAGETYNSRDNFNITFEIGSAENINAERQFDLITVFSSLHWVKGQEEALKNMVSALKVKGRLLILTFPQESPYYRVLEEVIHSSKWLQHSDSSACRYWLTSEQYELIISKLKLKKLFLKTYREIAIYQNENHFKDYVKGWLPCLITLPENLHDEFLTDLAIFAHQRYGKHDQEGFEIPYDKIVMYLEK